MSDVKREKLFYRQAIFSTYFLEITDRKEEILLGIKTTEGFEITDSIMLVGFGIALNKSRKKGFNHFDIWHEYMHAYSKSASYPLPLSSRTNRLLYLLCRLLKLSWKTMCIILIDLGD